MRNLGEEPRVAQNERRSWVTKDIVDAMIAGADIRSDLGAPIWDKAERSTMREGSSALLGELEVPTRKLIDERVVRINDLYLTMAVHAMRCGLRIRLPKSVRVCCGVKWRGSWIGNGPLERPCAELDLSEVIRRVKLHTPTPKERAKALSSMRWIEKWIADRMAGVERYAASLRKAQSRWEDELKSELAMRDLGANTPANKPKEEEDEHECPF